MWMFFSLSTYTMAAIQTALLRRLFCGSKSTEKDKLINDYDKYEALWQKQAELGRKK